MHARIANYLPSNYFSRFKFFLLLLLLARIESYVCVCASARVLISKL